MLAIESVLGWREVGVWTKGRIECILVSGVRKILAVS